MDLLSDPDRRPVLLFVLGALLGIGLAGWSLFPPEPDRKSRNPDAIARVNGRPIPADRYREALETARRERSRKSDTALARQVLDRLIDEELLLQRGLEMGLVRANRRLRSSLVQATVESILAQSPPEDPDTATLRQFYREQSDYFTRPERVRVHVMVFRDDSDHDTPARDRAREARRQLAAGTAWKVVRGRRADSPVIPVPGGLLNRSKLAQYLGSQHTRAAFSLEPGEVSRPLPFEGGHRLIHLAEAKGTMLPPFEENRSTVRSVYRHRREDRKLNRWLKRRRKAADLQVGDLRP